VVGGEDVGFDMRSFSVEMVLVLYSFAAEVGIVADLVVRSDFVVSDLQAHCAGPDATVRNREALQATPGRRAIEAGVLPFCRWETVCLVFHLAGCIHRSSGEGVAAGMRAPSHSPADPTISRSRTALMYATALVCMRFIC
jgi:hypothetical protein